jgi:hypothetical protein
MDKNLTKTERSILLYAETCVVDYAGLLEGQRMNNDDIEVLKKFEAAGILKFGRIPARVLGSMVSRQCTHWVEFTEAAWNLAHALRRQMAEKSKTVSANYKKVRAALDEQLAEAAVCCEAEGLARDRYRGSLTRERQTT